MNIKRAKEVGNNILKNTLGKSIAQHSFKKKVVTLSNNSTVRIMEEVIDIDPQFLFQRLVIVGLQNNNDLAEVFQYELCSYRPAILENKYTPRLANKASLGYTLSKRMPSDIPAPSGDVQYILEGGTLLHRIPWNRGLTYDEICQQYSRYVECHYGQPAVMFDGYPNEPSTKDTT